MASGEKFALAFMKKCGWEQGKGLGRDECGMTEALKPKLKFDSTGLGHDAAEEFKFQWWDHVFNKTASAIDVNKDEKGVVQLSGMGQVKVSKKLSSNHSNKPQAYRGFVTGGTLVGEKLNASSSDSDSEKEEIEKDCSLRLSDEQLFKICGGRTAHKGARLGFTMSAKLARVEEQERKLMEVWKKEDAEKKKREQEKIVNKSKKEIDNIENGNIRINGGVGKENKNSERNFEEEVEDQIRISNSVNKEIIGGKEEVDTMVTSQEEPSKREKKRRRKQREQEEETVNECKDESDKLSPIQEEPPKDKKKQKQEMEDKENASGDSLEGANPKQEKRKKNLQCEEENLNGEIDVAILEDKENTPRDSLENDAVLKKDKKKKRKKRATEEEELNGEVEESNETLKSLEEAPALKRDKKKREKRTHEEEELNGVIAEVVIVEDLNMATDKLILEDNDSTKQEKRKKKKKKSKYEIKVKVEKILIEFDGSTVIDSLEEDTNTKQNKKKNKKRNREAKESNGEVEMVEIDNGDNVAKDGLANTKKNHQGTCEDVVLVQEYENEKRNDLEEFVTPKSEKRKKKKNQEERVIKEYNNETQDDLKDDATPNKRNKKRKSEEEESTKEDENVSTADCLEEDATLKENKRKKKRRKVEEEKRPKVVEGELKDGIEVVVLSDETTPKQNKKRRKHREDVEIIGMFISISNPVEHGNNTVRDEEENYAKVKSIKKKKNKKRDSDNDRENK